MIGKRLSGGSRVRNASHNARKGGAARGEGRRLTKRRLLYQAQIERVAEGASVAGFEGAEDDADDLEDVQGGQQDETDEHKAEKGGHQGIDGDRDIEVHGLSGFLRDEGAGIPFPEPNDHRPDDMADAGKIDRKGAEVSNGAPQAVVFGESRNGGRIHRCFFWLMEGLAARRFIEGKMVVGLLQYCYTNYRE